MFFSKKMVLGLARKYAGISLSQGLSANKAYNAFRIFSYEKRAIFKGIRRATFLDIFREEKRQFQIAQNWLSKSPDSKRYIPKLRDMRTSPGTQYQYPIAVRYRDGFTGKESERFVTIMSTSRLKESDINKRLKATMQEEPGMFRYFRDSEIINIETYPYLKPTGKIQ